MLKNFLLVGLGGAIGSMLRFWISTHIISKNLPLATFIINVAGSFIIGLVIGASLKSDFIANNWKLFLATGICGGFTTFSSFSLENLQLLQQGKYLLCGLYIIGSLALGIATAFLGFKIMNN